MTRKSFLAALTVSVLGSLSMNSGAEAGGLRLGFGGPMASFLAFPTHGGYNAPASYGHCARKQAPSQIVSRQYSEPKIARSEAKVVRRDKEQVASAQSEPSKTSADSTVKTEKTSVSTADSTSTTTGPSASLALAQTDNAASKAAADAENKASDTVVVAESKASDTAAASTASSEVKTSESTKDVGCKKFIPSVGVTIDVGCKK